MEEETTYTRNKSKTRPNRSPSVTNFWNRTNKEFAGIARMTEEPTSLQKLLVGCFEHFIARPLGRQGRITRGVLDLEREAIEGELRGKTWHNLISYHHRWDPLLSNLSVFTLDTLADLLPSYIVAVLLWFDDIDHDPLLRRLLAPLWQSKCCDDEPDFPEFEQFIALLSIQQRSVVREFLAYMLALDRKNLERMFGTDERTILTAIEAIWGVSAK